jgi:hypothetical protein
MKKLRAMAFILFVAACSFFLVYRFWQSPGLGGGDQESPQTTDAHCNEGLWQYVYNPDRLQVLNPCISVTGTVEEIRKEADGDVHILFRLDQQFESLLNEKNIARQYGDLVLEPICQGKVRQPDAAEPCSQYNGPYFEPVVGQRYLVWGAYVHDADHGWNELHPVTSMQPIETTSRFFRRLYLQPSTFNFQLSTVDLFLLWPFPTAEPFPRSNS